MLLQCTGNSELNEKTQLSRVETVRLAQRLTSVWSALGQELIMAVS